MEQDLDSFLENMYAIRAIQVFVCLLGCADMLTSRVLLLDRRNSNADLEDDMSSDYSRSSKSSGEDSDSDDHANNSDDHTQSLGAVLNPGDNNEGDDDDDASYHDEPSNEQQSNDLHTTYKDLSDSSDEDEESDAEEFGEHSSAAAAPTSDPTVDTKDN